MINRVWKHIKTKLSTFVAFSIMNSRKYQQWRIYDVLKVGYGQGHSLVDGANCKSLKIVRKIYWSEMPYLFYENCYSMDI